MLGSFGAEWNGEPVPLGGRRQRSVLALLVSARGQVVPVDRMIEDLWRGAPPARAVTSLQAYVSNLRRLLEPGWAPRTPAKLLVSAPPGHALRLPDDAVDAWRFERLLRDARGILDSQPKTAGRFLEEALSLWQGPAYAETADEPWARAETARLEELRLVARELHVASGLRSADVTGTIPEAELLTRDEPLREEGWRLHALALWAVGRQADALAALRRARAVLADEVGLDPGPALTELEEAILTQRVEVLHAATGASPHRRPSPPVPPAQPTALAQPATGADLFVGRESELALLTTAADQALTTGPGVALVTGEAGLGKSALLERLACRLRSDGWLVAIGRNTDAEGAPAAWAWAEALRTVAAALPPPSGSADAWPPSLPQARQAFDAYGPLSADLLAAALAAAGQLDEARQVVAQAGPIRTDYFFKVFATFRAMAMVTLGEKTGAEELYASLLPYRDAPPPSSGFTVAIRPVAYTLGELARLLGRDSEAATHFARAATIAERWNSSLGLTG
ncbi:BTAD domain-containing putative transcriptional regulator [Streptomyces sp. NBC_01750]|uniref:BTAD domain-containing putative transcriptional regulator n=1 Tax=Streptomyces sp. NBC_01750 TaxID=2975928 RepID=UPI002DDB7F75|nr:BTAD domain-containing putative transcriptional regulator [Streptomyces sp. NBC_01750]WSD30943.1 AAA family ATPase [Streptomyces sp. NBC_01750]